MAHWSDMLDERAKKELLFSEKYVTEFNHGAMGHMVMNLVVTLKRELDRLYALLGAQGVDASPASDNVSTEGEAPVQTSAPASGEAAGDSATSESANTPADSSTPGA